MWFGGVSQSWQNFDFSPNREVIFQSWKNLSESLEGFFEVAPCFFDEICGDFLDSWFASLGHPVGFHQVGGGIQAGKSQESFKFLHEWREVGA